MMEVIIKHISEVTIGECEDYFKIGYDMIVDKHSKMVSFTRTEEEMMYLNGSDSSFIVEEYVDKAKRDNGLNKL